jgi:hypothetical protein
MKINFYIMNISVFLEKNEIEIIEESVQQLKRAQLKSYNNSANETNRYRLKKLYELCRSSVQNKNLLPIIEYSEKIAQERFNSGFDLHEVHTAYNVIEECIWKKIIEKVEPDKLGEYLGLISTVLGAGKETLALTYVSMAGKRKVSTLDLSGIFQR